MMLRKWRFLFLISLLCYTTDGHSSSSTIHELQESQLLRQVVRVAAKVVYDHSAIQRVEVLKVDQPNKGTVLLKDQLERFFHSTTGRSLDTHYSSFGVGGVKGCVYTVDDEELRKKVFVAFPGTQSAIEWSKNFFGITSFKHNVQQSYYDDIETLFSSTNEFSFPNTLKRHMASRGEAVDARNEYEYYFVGHSRGGGLAFLAAKRFNQEKETLLGREGGKIKVVTFCAPRLTNAHKEQFLWVEALGFCNIVHFTSASDIAPQFPFRFVENYGVKVPLKSFWSAKKSHEIPNEEEMNFAIQNFNLAQEVGWMTPIRRLFTAEVKSVLWGLGGVYLMYSMTKYGCRERVLEVLNAIHETSSGWGKK